jgi:hypothetical protein
MNPIYQIKIADPCHEDWNKMSPAEQGRFCGSCQKQVVDFSTMTDTEVIHHLQHATTSICARAGNDQLDRDIIAPSVKKYTVSKYWFALLAGISLLLSKAEAQTKKPKHPKRTPLVRPDQRKRLPGEIIMGAIATMRPVGQQWTLTGVVVDEEHRPIPFASVQIGSNGWGRSADSTGHFEIELDSRPDSLKVAVSSVGYDQRDLVVYPDKNGIVDMGEIMLTQKVLQEVVVSIDPTTKGKMELRCTVSGLTVYSQASASVKKLTGSNEIKVLPNPVSAGTNFKVQLAPKFLGEYTIQLSDMNGRILGGKKVNMTSPMQIETFDGHMFHSSGLYVVSLISHKDGKVYSSRLVVQ